MCQAITVDAMIHKTRSLLQEGHSLIRGTGSEYDKLYREHTGGAVT